MEDNGLNAVTLGFSVAYLGILVSAVVVPNIVSDLAAVIFGAVMGINEVAFRLLKRNAKRDWKRDEICRETEINRRIA